MKRIIYIIEDVFYPIPSIFTTLQYNFFVVANQLSKEKATELIEELRICLIHIINKGEKSSQDEFDKLKNDLYGLSTRLDMPKIFYGYTKIYEEQKPDREQIFQEIKNVIDIKESEYKFSILLDLNLFNSDSIELKKPYKQRNLILSQQIYDSYPQNSIPYTKYEDSTIDNRTNWLEGRAVSTVVLERYKICGPVIYKPLKNKIFSHLGIEV